MAILLTGHFCLTSSAISCSLLAAFLSPIVSSVDRSAADAAVAVRFFYGRSCSRSSRETALNGELFVIMVTKDGKKAQFKIVFHHRLKFYEAVVNADLGKETTELTGDFAIDGTEVPFRMAVRGATILGELGTGLDKGAITVEDFDR